MWTMRCWIAPPLLAMVLGAQGLTVPNQVVERDETGIPDPFPGTYGKFRQQFVIGSSWLAALQGRALTGMSFKRDGYLLGAMPGGQAQVVVRVSSLAVDPTRVSPAFAANHGARWEVAYNGIVTFPTSPALTHRDGADWSAPHSFRIDFLRPLPYSGGALCIEIDGEPIASALATRWRIDYRGQAGAGSVAHMGNGCGPVQSRSRHMAFVQSRDLFPGSAPRLLALGEPGSASMMMLATQVFPQPLSLAFLGAPGCTLDVVPLLTLPVGATTGVPARVSSTLAFPGDAAFAGAQLFLQWAHWAPTGLTTTEALSLTLATTMPSLDAAVVTSARVDGGSFPTVGFVSLAKMPVMRLHW